jgi:hypothetical protein
MLIGCTILSSYLVLFTYFYFSTYQKRHTTVTNSRGPETTSSITEVDNDRG